MLQHENYNHYNPKMHALSATSLRAYSSVISFSSSQEPFTVHAIAIHVVFFDVIIATVRLQVAIISPILGIHARVRVNVNRMHPL